MKILLAVDNSYKQLATQLIGIQPKTVPLFFDDGRQLLHHLFKMGDYKNVSRQLPDVIFLDMDCSTIAGRMVLRVIRNAIEFSNIEVIALSAHQTMAEKVTADGASLFIHKKSLGLFTVQFLYYLENCRNENTVAVK